MTSGELVGGRFRLVERTRAGGSGEVFRALDTHQGGAVACKLLAAQATVARERFAREATRLAALRHPGIVRHIDHGELPDGRPYLVLEWLEGETLAELLGRGPLTAGAAIELGRQVAEALGEVHRHGLVHGDVAPANVMVTGERAVLIDFGAAWEPAREGDEEHWGTPGYMAPEQAAGGRAVDARADVFSLGCVLFACLVGRGPFVGPSSAAVLAKVLLEPAPRVASLCPEVPDGLDVLLDQLLAKSPGQRPPDGAAVALALSALAAGHPLPGSRAALTRHERRAATLLLMSPCEAAPDEGAWRGLTGAAWVARLIDGTWVALLDGRGQAVAERAAQAALALRSRCQGPVVIVTERREREDEGPAGEAIDRAAWLLRRAAGAEGPLIDEATAALLVGRFALREEEGGAFCLLRARPGVGSLLGKPSPFVGRSDEVAALAAAFARCLQGQGPQAVLVLGEAGAGKTRLSQRWLEEVDERAEVWIARGDPLTAGSPLGLLGQLLRQALGVREGDPLEVRRRAVQERVHRLLPAAEAERVTEFLGALAGVTFPDSVQLRAAREDARLMGDQMRRAWQDWLAAECARHPLVLLLDDLQWGDLPSVRFLGESLRACEQGKLLVVALADPEVDLLFPGLWADRGVVRLELAPLSLAEGMAVAQHVLGGEGPAPPRLQALVERSGGHPFFLEELLRAAARGQGSAEPATALAILETRLEELASEARRALRAASCFGLVFWRGGVAELMGADPRESLRELLTEELIVPRASSRFVGEEEFAFRQALVRDAAYAMLTAEDVRLGHALAGRWLERQGERDPAVLAEHCERGGEGERAASFYRTAAEQALGGNDLIGAVAHAERAMRVDARGAFEGELRLLQAEALLWRGESAAAHLAAAQAFELLSVATPSWYLAAGLLASCSARLGRPDELLRVASRLRDCEATPSLDACCIARAQTALHLVFAGHLPLARDLLANVDEPRAASAAAAWLARARAQIANIDGDLQALLRHTDLAVDAHRSTGDLRNTAAQLANAGSVRNELGQHEDALARLREAIELAGRLGALPALAVAQLNLGMTLAHLGQLDEALATTQLARASFDEMNHRRLAAGARTYLARIHLLRGDPVTAASLARAALEAPDEAPAETLLALATLSLAHLASHEPHAALAASRAGLARLDRASPTVEAEAALRRSLVESLLALGHGDQARLALDDALAWLHRRAASLTDGSLRSSFLHQVADNARLLALDERCPPAAGPPVA